MSRFFSRRLSGLRPYVPGEQPRGRDYVKLNTNESPFPPSPRVLEALGGGEAARLNLYPDPEARAATSALAERHGLSPANVMMSNGSDEALAFCFQAFCDDSAPAVFPDVTYALYDILASLYGVPIRVVPLLPDFTVDLDGLSGACGGGRAAIFLANPNAPTGLAVGLESIERLLASNPDAVLVVDEAYAAFGAESAAPLIRRHGNLAVVHTMSKSRNLAGARIGYVIADEGLIADLNSVRYSFNPYSVGRLALAAAEAAIRDDEYHRECVAAIVKTRELTARELERRGFDVLPSLTNFVLARPGFIGGGQYQAALKDRGVLVRHFAEPERIREFVRITIGAEWQMRALLDATDEIMREL